MQGLALLKRIGVLIISLFTFGVSQVPVAQASESWDLSYDIINILDNGSTGGSFGFRLKRVNGSILADYNASGLFGQFYPASTIKVLHHLHAMMWIEQQGLGAVNTPITIYGNSCSGTNPTGSQPLLNVLLGMMVNSNNQQTNAIQDWFGAAALNETAHDVVGMSYETELNHKFGCGGPTNDPANRMTIADITLLYERYADGDFLSPLYMGIFESVMPNEANNNFLSGVINAEASDLGISNATLNAFNNDFNLAYKPGSIPASVDGTLYRSRAGYVTLPRKTCQGIVKRDYVFGVFIDGADSIDSDLDSTAVREILRGQIRSALNTFKVVTAGTCLGGSDDVQIAPRHTHGSVGSVTEILRIPSTAVDHPEATIQY